jgi:large subunit ribosomal protein L6
MSRIGKQPITLPAGVTLTVDSSNVVSVKGPKGNLSTQIDPELKIEVEGSTATVIRPTDQKRHRAAHGLYRSLVNNMVTGVNEGYKLELELVGVGYKADSTGQLLELNLGFSHLINIVIPKEIKVSTETKKGVPPRITLEGIDKQLVGHIAAKIRGFRRPEPYKGKGVRYVGEEIRRKAGKAAAKK